MDQWLAECDTVRYELDRDVMAQLEDLLQELYDQVYKRDARRSDAIEQMLLTLAIDHPSVSTVLIRFFEFIDPARYVQWEVIFPLGKVLGELASFRPDVATVMLRATAEPLGHSRRQAATFGLAERFRQPTNGVVQVALKHLDHQRWAVRAAAAGMLAKAVRPDPTVLSRLTALMGDRSPTVRGVAEDALRQILRTEPELCAHLPAVLQTDLYGDIARWYRNEEADFPGAVPALLAQPESTRMILLAAIYGDNELVRDFVIRTLNSWAFNPDAAAKPYAAHVLRLLEKGLPPAVSSAQEAIERLAIALGAVGSERSLQSPADSH